MKNLSRIAEREDGAGQQRQQQQERARLAQPQGGPQGQREDRAAGVVG